VSCDSWPVPDGEGRMPLLWKKECRMEKFFACIGAFLVAALLMGQTSQ
jgi:hypothetical protein